MLLEVRGRLQKVLEKAYEVGKVTHEGVLDGVMALGVAYMWMDGRDDYKACFERAKEGFVLLLGEKSSKAVRAAFLFVGESAVDEIIVEFRWLWEKAKVSLANEAVTCDIVKSLGIELYRKCCRKWQFEEAKVFYLAALEWRRRVLGEKNKDTLMSLYNFGNLLQHTEDYEGALDYYL